MLNFYFYFWIFPPIFHLSYLSMEIILCCVLCIMLHAYKPTNNTDDYEADVYLNLNKDKYILYCTVLYCMKLWTFSNVNCV